MFFRHVFIASVFAGGLLAASGCTESVVRSASGSDGGGLPLGDAGSGPSGTKTCVQVQDGLQCQCSFDEGFSISGFAEYTKETVAECDVPTTLRYDCCAQPPDVDDDEGESCRCDVLACAITASGCRCDYALGLGDGSPVSLSDLTTSCPAPGAGEQCCNAPGGRYCSCGSAACPDGFEEVARCSADMLASMCDDDEPKVPDGTCKTPSEL